MLTKSSFNEVDVVVDKVGGDAVHGLANAPALGAVSKGSGKSEAGDAVAVLSGDGTIPS